MSSNSPRERVEYKAVITLVKEAEIEKKKAQRFSEVSLYEVSTSSCMLRGTNM